jgi:hypothetical protein
MSCGSGGLAAASTLDGGRAGRRASDDVAPSLISFPTAAALDYPRRRDRVRAGMAFTRPVVKSFRSMARWPQNASRVFPWTTR